MLWERAYVDPSGWEQKFEALTGIPPLDEFLSQVISNSSITEPLFSILSKLGVTNEHKAMTTQQDLFLYGFMKQAFKFEPRQTMTCLNNGKEMLYKSLLMALKFVNQPWVKDISFNFNDAFIKWLDLCWYWDTIEGVLFLSGAVFVLDMFFPRQAVGGSFGFGLKIATVVFELATYILDGIDFTIFI
mmetsp:Transcript_35891/g.55095  ORF Transcript_35891/g.55095 Transcript_35891/m.55095 type:complete len:187 (-) Transcript_35891:143-703(-)